MASAGMIYRNYNSTDTTSQGLTISELPQPPASWEREGYFFKEWNTSRDGSGTSYQPGDGIPVTGEAYAIWYGDYIEAVKDSSGIEHPIKDTISGYITSASVPSASSTTPKMDGTAAVGTETAFARGDHIHPTDTSRQTKITASGILKGDGSGGVTAATAGTDYMTPANVSSNYVPFSKSSAGSSVTITDSPSLNSNTFSITASSAGSYSSKLNLSVDPNTGSQVAYLNAGSNTLRVSNTGTTIKNVVTPSADGDAANKKYVDDSIGALDGGTIGTGSTTKTITSLSQSNGNVSATFSDIAFPVTSVNGQTGAVTTAEKFVIAATAISGTEYYNLDKTYADILNAIGGNKYVSIQDMDATYPYTTITTQGIVFGATLLATSNGQLMAITDGILVVQPDSGTNAMGMAVHSSTVLPTISDIPSASSTTPSMDGTAAVGTGTTWARADHVHPTDTSRQAVLVSGTNIKTINNESILGSGNISISAGSSDVFIAEYDTTTYNQIQTALNAGKLVFVPRGTGAYVYAGEDTEVISGTEYDYYIFTNAHVDGRQIFEVRVRNDNVWSSDNIYVVGDTSPQFYGTPTAPTAAAGTNTTQLATTAFVQTAITNIDTDSANATNSTSKLFLIGATSQTASPDTYSNSDVYGTNGALNAKSFSVDASANIVYNSSAKSIDFTFV